jgi:DNA topoisomerase-1
MAILRQLSRFKKPFRGDWDVFIRLLAGKKHDDDLFDTLNTTKVNTHLKGLMPGLTAKVFRTYNASYTLDKLVSFFTPSGNAW